jgi:hypothetical protein
VTVYRSAGCSPVFSGGVRRKGELGDSELVGSIGDEGALRLGEETLGGKGRLEGNEGSPEAAGSKGDNKGFKEADKKYEGVVGVA